MNFQVILSEGVLSQYTIRITNIKFFITWVKFLIKSVIQQLPQNSNKLYITI